jgi:hypothetical protein
VSILDVAKIIQQLILDTIIIPGNKKDDSQIVINEPSLFIENNHWKPSVTLKEGIKLILAKLVRP